MAVIGRTLFPGAASGPLLILTAPLSFWGGVDPETGRIVDPGHPQTGASLTGKVVAIPRLIGSSSSSSVMLELIRAAHAPAALLLGVPDAILIVGCLAGRELGYRCPPVAALDLTGLAAPGAGEVSVNAMAERAAVIVVTSTPEAGATPQAAQ